MEGTGLLARAFVDGINPFGKRDMYEAGQAFMGLTLLLSRGLLTVPPTRLPVLGPRISRRMGRIPYTFEALEPYGLGGPSTRVIGLTRMATGEVMINENLRAFEHLLPYEDIEQFGSAAIDGVAELRAVIAHERSHAVRTLAYPRRLRPLRARLLKRSSVLTYLEEAAAEGDALGWRAGLMYPIEDGDVRLYKLIPEALAVGALGLSGFYGRHGTGPRDERLEQETIIAEDGYAF